ncbi:MAG: anthranilate phosphoribosyltransferase [Planctomycetes bacterium]|nr:anthranilate phosphoribosyltransferase [Planctomycetota bacterium]
MIREAIDALTRRRSLSRDEAAAVMNEILAGQATPAQIAAFLVGLRLKGETVDEVVGCVNSLRANAKTVRPETPFYIDTCGTGGDGSHTFNVSTVVAFVAAGAGIPVAKHGNRSVSSSCGSADLLEFWGIPLESTPEAAARCLDRIGIVFLFAPAFHPAARHAAGVRKEIGVRTVFNLIGPLANPANAPGQVMGVYDPAWVPLAAEVLRTCGSKSAMVVHGDGGLDELSLTGESTAAILRDGSIRTTRVAPEDAGLPRREGLDGLRVANVQESRALAERVLAGESGPARDLVLLNAAAAGVVADRAPDLRAGVRLAAESIDSGAARGKLEALRAFRPTP